MSAVSELSGHLRCRVPLPSPKPQTADVYFRSLPFLLRGSETPPRPVGSALGEGIAGLKDLWSHVLLKDGEQALPVGKAKRITANRTWSYYLCLVFSHTMSSKADYR